MNKGVLGKGLSALIPNNVRENFAEDNRNEAATNTDRAEKAGALNAPAKENRGVHEIDIKRIIPNTNQPRKHFKAEHLEELAESIKIHGVLQPVVVIEKKDGVYELIAGERRLRASKLLGLATIPVIIKEADGLKKLELALIENLQREDLNPIEEGRAYRKLIDEFGVTQEEISKRVRKGRSSIANYLRYLRLPEEIQQGLIEGKINEGHAKVLAALDDPDAQLALYKKSVKDNLTVRNVEIIADEIQVRSHKRKAGRELSPLVASKEKLFSDYLGFKVKIKPGRKGGGKIIVNYYSNDDLERLSQKFEQ